MRYRYLLLLIPLLLLVGSCREHLRGNACTHPLPAVDRGPYAAFFHLSPEQQHNYVTVCEQISHSVSTTCTVSLSEEQDPQWGIAIALPHPLTNEEAHALYRAIVQDNPQFFFLSPTYGLEGNGHEGETRYTQLKVLYYMDAAQRVAAAKQLQALCADWLSALPNGDEFEKELFLHDKLLAHCTYADRSSAEASPPLSAYSAYGALVEGRAVCEGYSRAFQYLLTQAGLSATVIIGKTAQQQPHMWNIVMVNGAAYHVDTTNNDTLPYPHHAYFNLSDQQLPHTIDDPYAAGYPCTATADNYYRRTGRLLTTFRQEEIARFIADQLTHGFPLVEWHCPSQETYVNALFFLQSGSWLRETVNACLPAETPPLGDYVITEEAALKTLFFYEKQS